MKTSNIILVIITIILTAGISFGIMKGCSKDPIQKDPVKEIVIEIDSRNEILQERIDSLTKIINSEKELPVIIKKEYVEKINIVNSNSIDDDIELFSRYISEGNNIK